MLNFQKGGVAGAGAHQTYQHVLLEYSQHDT